MYDMILKNGKVIDGAGNCWFAADVGIGEGRINAVGKVRGESRTVLDVSGLVVCPGFIDIHSHSELSAIVNPKSDSKVMQGVTTEVVGNCGISPSPVEPRHFHHLTHHYVSPELRWAWPGFTDYLKAYKNSPASVNIVPLVGHGTLRIAVMGFANRPPEAEELVRMKALLREALDAGAFGLSTGLIYTPACYSETREIVELAMVLKEEGRLYATHIRGEGRNLINAVREALTIAQEAGVRVELAHHKASGIENWGRVSETLRLIDEARTRGIDATCDVYPYPACSTNLAVCLPPWVREDSSHRMIERINDRGIRERIKAEMESEEAQGFWTSTVKSIGWDRIVIAAVQSERNKVVEAMNLAEIAEARKAEPFEVFFDLLTEENGKVPCIYFEMREEDVRTVLSSPVSMIGSDGRSLSPVGILGQGKPHPRNYGTFPRVLAKYVREERLLTLEEAIRKMTSFPAQKLVLRDRGLIREGFWADVVVLDPSEVADTATFKEPAQFPKGIEYVLVNGEIVVSKGNHTGATPGQLLRPA
jgi:N-acyl-D-amino-acid deacylase